MLTLDPTTLFYWTLSDTPEPPPKKMKYSVESWAKTIPSSAKPSSRATSQANSVKTGKLGSIRNGSALASASRSQATISSSASVLTTDIAVTYAQVPQAVKIKQDKDAIQTYDGGLSDCEEIAGVERDAALVSPIKGKKRLDSGVSVRHCDISSCI